MTGAVFGYAIGCVIHHRQTFRHNRLAGLSLIAASGLACGLFVDLSRFVLTLLDPVIARCHDVL